MNNQYKGKLDGRIVLLSRPNPLRAGDEVLVVKPTNRHVYSARTGRAIGIDEKILGRGTVIEKDDKLVVQLEKKSSQREDSLKSLRMIGSTRTPEVIVKLLNKRMI